MPNVSRRAMGKESGTQRRRAGGGGGVGGEDALPFQPPSPAPPILPADHDASVDTMDWTPPAAASHSKNGGSAYYNDAEDYDDVDEEVRVLDDGSDTPTPPAAAAAAANTDAAVPPDGAFAFSRRGTLIPSRSGCWSSFSWSSLYERRTESSLSWGDDELEKETTETVENHFREIDCVLFGDGVEDSPLSMSTDLRHECDIWKRRYPHIRVVGAPARLSSPARKLDDGEDELKSVPNRSRGVGSASVGPASSRQRRPSRIPRPKSRSRNKPSEPQSQQEDSKPQVMTAEEALFGKAAKADEEEISTGEETYVSHGEDISIENVADYEINLMDGLTVNQRFEEQPRSYFEEKVLTAAFRKVWSQLSPEFSSLASLFGERVIEDSMEMLSLTSSREGSAAVRTRGVSKRPESGGTGRFNGHLLSRNPHHEIAAIDENSVFQQEEYYYGGDMDDHSSNYFQGGGGAVPAGIMISGSDPVSLPNLSNHRAAAGSAPPSRDVQSGVLRPVSSSQRRPLPQRFRRTNSFKGEKKTSPRHGTATADLTVTGSPPGTREGRSGARSSMLAAGQQQSSGRGGTQSHPLRRLRSQSGSPPRSQQRGSGTNKASSNHHPQQQQPPLSLPPIQGTTIGPGRSTASAASKASSPPPPTTSSAAATSGLGFSMSSGRVPLGGIISSGVKATSPRQPHQRSISPSPALATSFSVSGRRLKSLGKPPTPSVGAQPPQPPLPPSSSSAAHQRLSSAAGGPRSNSRMSLNGPVHWDVRTSQADSRFKN